jgi:hypothetical protein
MRILALVLLALLVEPALGQAKLVTKIKPPMSAWAPGDFSSVEIRAKGRLSTDPPTTTARLLGMSVLKGIDVAMLTQRVTILVPANQTWEIKSISVLFTPILSTGYRPYEAGTLDFPSYFPTPGQTLAIDVNINTGEIFFMPVAVTAPPLPVGCATKMPPAAQLTDAAGALWTLLPRIAGGANQTGVARDGLRVTDSSNYVVIIAGVACQLDETTWECWTGQAKAAGGHWVSSTNPGC